MLPKKRSCKGCEAMCCRYITIELDIPETLDDFENIKWYVAHENVVVNIEEDGSWFVKFFTKCKHLTENNLCAIYKNRPRVCREHKVKSCERYNPENFLLTFKSIEDVEKYIENVFKKGRHEIN